MIYSIQLQCPDDYDNLQFNFIMEDPYDINFAGKYYMQRQKPQSNHVRDPYAVQPWQKNTVQIDLANQQERSYKTFYQTPISRLDVDRHYITHRGFSFRKNSELIATREKDNGSKHKHKAESFSRTTITQYNINGNFLSHSPKVEDKKFSNQFYEKRTKAMKDSSKDRLEYLRDIEFAGAGLSSIKRRVSLNKEAAYIEDRQFLKLRSESNEDENTTNKPSHLPLNCLKIQRRRSKIISLGFRKLANLRGLVKQRSASIQSNNIL